jgi:molybdate transport system substrate-binding protein
MIVARQPKMSAKKPKHLIALVRESQGWTHCILWVAIIISLSGVTGCKPTNTAKSESRALSHLTVFSAASTTNAVQDLAELYKSKTGVTLVASFASSSTLAKQIEQGAPADVYISANPKWMDYLEGAEILVNGTREDLLGNRIVLIAPRSSALGSVEIASDFDLVGLLGDEGRLAMGDPAHVPAGMYGKQALQALGLWTSVGARVAPMGNVRAALTIVERGETPLGIVYATDAAMSDKVKVVGLFPAESHPPIVYPVAMVSMEQLDLARAFLDFLNSPEAGEIFQKFGFSLAD